MGSKVGARMKQGLSNHLGMMAFALVLLQIAFYFDSSYLLSSMPVRPSYVLEGISLFTLFIYLVRHRFQMKLPMIPLSLFLVFILLLLPSLLSADLQSTYVVSKLQKFFELTVPVTLLAPMIVKDWDMLRKLMNAYALVSLFIVFDSSVLMMELGMAGFTAGRNSSLGTDPISLGRSAGYLIIWLANYMTNQKSSIWRFFIGMPLMVLSVGMLLASGSRGPFALTLLFVLVLFAMKWHKAKGSVIRFVVLTAAVLMALVPFVITVIPPDSLARIQGLLSGNLNVDHSAALRFESYQLSWQMIQTHPFGIGFGNFQIYIPVTWWGSVLNYPHDMIIEIFLEQGWFSGLYFLFMIVISMIGALRLLMMSRRSGHGQYEVPLFIVAYLFILVNAMLSGDLNSNRSVFFFMIVMLRFAFSSQRVRALSRDGSDRTYVPRAIRQQFEY